MPGSSGYAVGWGALALINAGLAQGKRRSGLFWFVISLLLGPAATLLIVLLPLGGESAQPLQRADLVVLGIVVFILAALVVGLLATGARFG